MPEYLSDKFQRGVSVLSWAYNEEDLIEDFIRRLVGLLESTVEDYEIILVNDGSTDRTREIVEGLLDTFPRIKLLNNDKNRNVSYSFQRARQEVSKEFVFWQTVDWSYEISHLRLILEKLNTADVVVGTRRIPTGDINKVVKPLKAVRGGFSPRYLKQRSDTRRKGFISMVNYSLIRVLFRVPLSDYQNLMFFKADLLKSLKIESNSSFTAPELLLKSYWMGKTIAEAPIDFIPREAGAGSGTKFTSILNAIRDIFRFYWRWILLGKREHKQKGTVQRLNFSEWNL